MGTFFGGNNTVFVYLVILTMSMCLMGYLEGFKMSMGEDEELIISNEE